jgi:hypothetical protein
MYEEMFGEKYVKEKYKLEPHQFTECAGGKQYCRKCGLVALNNEFTRWSIEKGCLSELHPQYKHKRKLTNPF